MIGTSKMFKLGDVVLITDTYYNKQFTAHCIKKIESKIDGVHKFEFVFSISQDPQNIVSYIVGEDRSRCVIQFTKLIGNIYDGEDQVQHK